MFNSIGKKEKIERILVFLCFVLGIGIITLNISLAFDHVLWGDEAFSANVIRNTNAFGIFQRIYYWDSHPPLYYYWLKLFTLCFGESVAVYHFASLIPFIICMFIVLIPIRKELGTIPAAFFMVICGMSSVTAEYNLEVRMYELCFLFILISMYCSACIMRSEKIRFWVIMTVTSVLAAYTHYFGLVVGGLILFYTGLFYFIRHRAHTWRRGVLCIIGFWILYTPWLFVFIRQTKSVQNSWWLKEIAPLNVLLNVIYCGKNLYPILFAVSIILTIYVFVRETKLIYLTFNPEKKCIEWHLCKPGLSKCSNTFITVMLGWAVIISTVLFTYIASLIINPMTIGRYMYSLVPISLFMFAMLISRFIYFTEHSDKPIEDRNVCLIDTSSERYKWFRRGLVFILFVVISFICLFDFKYYRSKSKTEELFTQITLNTVGQPNEDAVMIGNQVKHLSWTVLPYYYPDNKVQDCRPDQLEENPSEIWAFLGYHLNDDEEKNMKTKGYKIECWDKMWVGKYECTLYHFYK